MSKFNFFGNISGQNVIINGDDIIINGKHVNTSDTGEEINEIRKAPRQIKKLYVTSNVRVNIYEGHENVIIARLHGTASTKATASVSYAVPAAANYILAGDSQSVKVNQLTVEFAAAAAGATSGEFVPKTFTISGTFAVYGDTTGTKLSEDFEEIVLEGVTGTITSSDAKITATGGKFTAFTGTNTYAVAPATDKGSVTADILTEAGPALVGTGADTKLAPLGEVVLEYPTTESLV